MSKNLCINKDPVGEIQPDLYLQVAKLWTLCPHPASLCRKSAGQTGAPWMQIAAGNKGNFGKLRFNQRVRLASKFFVCQSSKIAGILGVFQDFGAKTGGKFAVKMRPGIYSEVSLIQ